MNDFLTDPATTETVLTNAKPTISAEAVEAVRRGVRWALRLASRPGTEFVMGRSGNGKMRLMTRLAGAATGGLRNPREVVGPFVQVLLDLRLQVRADKRFDLSDMIRDRLAEISVEVRDTPQGAEWGFRK